MLRIDSQAGSQASRRDFLTVGTAGVGGLSLASLLAIRAGAAELSDAVRDRSVVFLNLQGGPTQFETFDPNMQAPSEIRSITGQIPTSLPGVTFGGTLPRLARLADRMAIVRSYRHGISSHGPAAHHVMAGGNPSGAMMGAIYSTAAGLSNPRSGLPRNVLVTAAAAGEKYKDLYKSVSRVSQTGTLSPIHKPFDLGAGGTLLDNMTLRLDQARLDDRRQLLESLDALKRKLDRTRILEGASRFEQQAFDVLARGVATAFDLSQEDPRLLERYDTGAFEPGDGVRTRNEYAKQFSPVALGRQMLLARRLCEAGCGFVTVTCGGWDMHGGGKEFTMADGIASLTPAIDKGVSAFIEDVESRGLGDQILLVITGEFGRTPRINKNGGRDHWGNLCPVVFVGGGLPMGQVIGQSTRDGGEPATDPISSGNILATLMHSLFDVSELRLVSGIPKDVESLILGGTPIPQLIEV